MRLLLLEAYHKTKPRDNDCFFFCCRRWILDLGVEIKDGDGGFIPRSLGSVIANTEAPSIAEDRLRNGLLLADLALVCLLALFKKLYVPLGVITGDFRCLNQMRRCI